MKRSVISYGLAALLVSTTAHAQTQISAPTSISQEQATTALKEDLFAVAASQDTYIFEDKAVPLKLRLASVTQLPDAVSVQGVSAEGFTRYVTVDGKKIGQAVITKLRKGNRSVDLKPENFSSQFELLPGETQLTPDKILQVDGNEAELVSALQKLDNPELAQVEEDEENQEEEARPQQDRNQSAGQGQGGGRATGTASGGGSKNPIAAQYENPDPVERPPDIKKEIRVTKEGCELVIDPPSGVVREQTKMQTFENGVLVSEEACAPSGVTFPIQKSANTCSDVVDLDARRAVPQFISYFNDANGIRQEISDCEPDQDAYFEITEKEVCPVQVSIADKKAIIQTKLTYTNGKGRDVVVRDCRASEEIAPIPMQQDFAACSLRHDFAGGQTVAMATWIYEYQGQFYQASPCMETNQVYRHEQITKVNGVDLCPVIVDLNGNQATPQYRTQIQIDGQKMFIDDCKPQTDGRLAILATTNTCDNPATFQHDMDAGLSYGLQRFYYENPERVYVSDCIFGEPTYNHIYAQNNWFMRDDDLVGQKLTDISIHVNGKQHFLERDKLMAGEPEVAYVALPDQTKPTTKYHEQCNVFQRTQVTEAYMRPNDTRYEMASYPGPDQSLGNKCEISNQGWEHVTAEKISYQRKRHTVRYDDVSEIITTTRAQPGVPWELISSRLGLPGSPYYEGCEYRQDGYRVDTYRRPDNTTVSLDTDIRVNSILQEDTCQVVAIGNPYTESTRGPQVSSSTTCRPRGGRGSEDVCTTTYKHRYTVVTYQQYQRINGGGGIVETFTEEIDRRTEVR